MGIALPNGVENGVHQLVKVALSSMVALFGTYQIAANGVAIPLPGRWATGCAPQAMSASPCSFPLR